MKKHKESRPFFKPSIWCTDGEHPTAPTFHLIFSNLLTCSLSRKISVTLCSLPLLPTSNGAGRGLLIHWVSHAAPHRQIWSRTPQQKISKRCLSNISYTCNTASKGAGLHTSLATDWGMLFYIYEPKVVPIQTNISDAFSCWLTVLNSCLLLVFIQACELLRKYSISKELIVFLITSTSVMKYSISTAQMNTKAEDYACRVGSLPEQLFFSKFWLMLTK